MPALAKASADERWWVSLPAAQRKVCEGSTGRLSCFQHVILIFPLFVITRPGRIDIDKGRNPLGELVGN